LGVLAAACVLAPATAWACEEPTEPEERERIVAVAGERVELELPDAEEGVRWEIRRKGADDEDDPIAKGRDDEEEQGVEAVFEVPDLGEEERTLTLDVLVGDPGAERACFEVVLDYQGRPAAPEPDEPAEPEEPRKGDEGSSAPPPAPPASPPDRSARSQPAPAIVAPPPAPPATTVPPPMIVTGASAPVRRLAPLEVPGEPGPDGAARVLGGVTGATFLGALQAVAPAAERAAKGWRMADEGKGARSRDRHRRPVPDLDAAGFGEPARPAGRAPAEEGGIRLADVAVPGFGSGVLWNLIAGGALAFAAAGAGVALLASRRRRRLAPR
jgi:hypothetical protein